MKVADIKPGTIYAVPLSAVGLERSQYGYRRARKVGTAKDVSDGTFAAPFRVIAVGKFRWQRQGACEQVIAADHYETTIHGEVLDGTDHVVDWRKPNDNWKHADFNSKKTKWREVIVRTGIIVMPWESFKTRYDENQLVQMELQAYAEKHQKLTTELKKNIATAVTKKYKLDRTGRVALRHNNTQASVLIEFTVDVDELLTVKDRKLKEEIANLEKKMSCSPDTLLRIQRNSNG